MTKTQKPQLKADAVQIKATRKALKAAEKAALSALRAGRLEDLKAAKAEATVLQNWIEVYA